MNLYELTRALVARGCPEHPRIALSDMDMTDTPHADYENGLESLDAGGDPRDELAYIHNDDARDLWTMHALRWAFGSGRLTMLRVEPATDLPLDLERIEAATRHLEPSHE